MKRFIAVALIVACSFLFPVSVSGGDNSPVKMRVTCYLPTGNPTASGVMPFKGGCAAKRDWMGCAAVLYTLDGEYIGVWDINDTGGHDRIKSGKSVDLFMPTMEEAKEWIREYGDYLLVQIIPAEG